MVGDNQPVLSSEMPQIEQWSLNASIIARAKELRDLKASNKRASHVVG